MLYVWYPKSRTDLNAIQEENDVIEMGELARVKEKVKWGKHTCLIMRMEHPRAYQIHCVKRSHSLCQEIIRLLIRDHKTPDKRS